MCKKKLKEVEGERKEERLGLVIAWDRYAKANGLDIEWRHKRKEVRIRWQCEVCHVC